MMDKTSGAGGAVNGLSTLLNRLLFGLRPLTRVATTWVAVIPGR